MGMLNKERYFWLGLIFILLLINLSPFSIQSLAYNKNNKKEEVYLSVLNEALYHIRSKYIDESKIDYKNLIYGAINGMINATKDDHSTFLSEETYKELNKNLKGTFHGIGIYISIKDGYPIVIAPIEDTPAHKVGLKPEDKIVEIEGKPTKGLNIREVVKKLKGLKNTKVSIKVLRENELELIPFTITRAVIKVKSVKFKFINKRKGLAYIRIATFSKNTTTELKKALNYLNNKGMKKLIVDLRNNPGGLLNVVHKVCDMFLNKGVIVSTKGRNNKNNKTFFASPENTILNIKVPLVVLINEGSASASEIFAGAIQDTKRGTIIGVKSFGKGSVQEVISLNSINNNVAIKITTQKYLTPKGRSIHKKGIIPDVIVKVPKKSFEQLYMERKLHNGKYLSRFIKKYPNYSSRNIDKLIATTKKDGISLERSTIKKLILLEKNRNKILVYDLNHDIQLSKAVDKIESQKYDANMVKVFK